MRVVVRLFGVVVLACLLAGVQERASDTPSTDAAFPGANGKIAFISSRDAGQGIYVTDPDSPGVSKMPTGSLLPDEVEWSADGQRVAFTTAGNNQIFVMDADGNNLVPITNPPEFADHPTWSPDGTKIAFQGGNAIWVANANGTGGRVKIAGGEAGEDKYANTPEWSPDGSKIAYLGNFLGIQAELFTVSPNGGTPTQLTNSDPHYGDLSWSPDGTRIATSDFNDIIVLTAAGAFVRKLTNDGCSTEPAWSPDGSKIAFKQACGGQTDIFVMNADGTGTPQNVTNDAIFDASPDWQPIPGECPGTAAAVIPASLSTDDDTDGDNIPDNVENNITNTDPNCQDTDGDGLLDPWEVEENVEGAGFDLDGDGVAEVKRDQVFGPYAGQCGNQGTGLRFEPTGQNCGTVLQPDPLHKDVYIEMDWQDCALGNCPELIGFPTDPSHHAPDMAGLIDVVNVFRNAPVENPDDVDGVNLHILVDEAISHFHNCDQGASAARSASFGTEDQRLFNDFRILQAREMVYRYAWSGHSSIEDYDPGRCLLPSFFDIIASGAGLADLPYYDDSPFGDATFRGRDVLVTLAVAWVCQLYSFDTIPAALGELPPCFRTITGVGTVVIPGLFPADIAQPNGGSKHLELPMHMTLGIPPADGVRQLWGRGFARLLGTSLGVAPGALGNHPTTTGAQPVNDYGSWSGLLYAPPAPASGPSIASEGSGEPEPIFPDYTLALQDQDGDGVAEAEDTCPGIDAPQDDLDADGLGDACDNDADADGAFDNQEAFPGDTDDDGSPNGSDADDDNDGIGDGEDNCPLAANEPQADIDADGEGDACDGDMDGDGLPNFFEELTESDPEQAGSRPEFIGNGETCSDGEDNDGDGDTDGADGGCADDDGDSVPDSVDNCPGVESLNLLDSNGDGTGDSCEPQGTPRTWGDNNCSGNADPVDSLLTLRFNAALSTDTGDCPSFGQAIGVANTPASLWGDVDCSGDVGPVDSLKLLRFDAGLSVAQEPQCPQLGSLVSVSDG